MDPAQAWKEALGRSTLDAQEFLVRVAQAGVLFDGRPLCVHRQPIFLTEEKVQAFARILAAFHSAVRKAKACLLDDGLGADSLAAAMGLSAEERELASIDPGHPSASTISRIDTFCPDGHPWILELNAESPTGIGYSDALTTLLREDPIFADVGPFGGFRSADAALRALLETYSEWGGKGSPRLAIVDFLDVPTRSDFHLLADGFERYEVACPLVDPRDLRFEGGVLQGPDGPIDLVYRRLLVRDIVERPRDCAALLAAYRAGAICMVNSLRTPLLHSKGLFALLHSELLRPQLSPAELKVIREHVPFTAMLGPMGPLSPPDLHDRLLSNPADWALKPCSSSGGQGVVLGRDCTPEAWKQALEQQGLVVQRFVPEWTQPFPNALNNYEAETCLVDLDPFLIRGRLAGFMCRLSQTAPVNVARGAHIVPVFVSSGEVE